MKNPLSISKVARLHLPAMFLSAYAGIAATAPQLTLLDVNAGGGNGAASWVVTAGGVRYFVADDGVHGFELWRTDGTEEGTVMVADINPGASGSNPWHLTAVGGLLFFAADCGQTGVELWKSNGTTAGTVRLTDIAPGSAGSNLANMLRAGNWVT